MNVTTHSGIAQMMMRTLRSYGLDTEALFAQVGLASPTSFTSQDRVEAVAMQKLWRLAVEQTADEAFGIRFAQQLHPMSLHGLGFSWMASDTLKDAIKRLVRYYRLITSAGEVVLEETTEGYRLCYRYPAPKGAAAPASIDAAMAVFIQLCRLAKGDEVQPLRVELQRPTPQANATHSFDTFFQSPIQYDCDENCLFFEAAALEASLPNANPELARANDQVVINYLKAFDKKDIVSQIRATIIECLPAGTPSQEQVASLVHMSTRSMQRKLQEKETRFKAIVEDIRQELAETYLKDPQRSVGEVTYLLGYSEPSNFSRSFKKWTGISPAEYQVRFAS